VYLKGDLVPIQPAYFPEERFGQELKQAQPPPANEMKMQDLVNSPLFPSGIFTRTSGWENWLC
jgi:hypothetical protein